MSSAEAALAQQLNRDCRCTGIDVPELRQWLDRDLRRRGLTEPVVATHPHLFSDLPVFVAREHVQQMQAIIRAVESVVAMPAYQEEVLARAPSIARKPQAAQGVFFGYDFHLCERGPQLIEINTNAGGALLNTASMRAQRACCAPVERYLKAGQTPEALERSFAQMFRREWRGRASQQLKRIAIVDDSPTRQYLYPEFLLVQQVLESHGIAAVIGDARELTYGRSGLTLHGEAIDLVYNRLTDFYFEDPAHAALANAYEAGDVVVTPHPHAHALYANKENLAVLSCEAQLRALQVAGPTIEVLVQGIPETHLVTHEQEKWWADRKRWFFKPASGYGGRGSYRGDKLTRKAFAEVIAGGYVAQAIAPPSERGGGGDAGYKLDVRNYAYGAETLLMAARLYQGQTTNFRTPGGGFAPVYVVPDALAS